MKSTDALSTSRASPLTVGHTPAKGPFRVRSRNRKSKWMPMTTTTTSTRLSSQLIDSGLHRESLQRFSVNLAQAPLDPSRGLIIAARWLGFVSQSVRRAAGSPPATTRRDRRANSPQGRVSRTFACGPLRGFHRFSPAATPTASLAVGGHVRPTRPKGFGQRAPAAGGSPRRAAGSWRVNGETQNPARPSTVSGPLEGNSGGCGRLSEAVSARCAGQLGRSAPVVKTNLNLAPWGGGPGPGRCYGHLRLSFGRGRQDLPQGDPHRIAYTIIPP